MLLYYIRYSRYYIPIRYFRYFEGITNKRPIVETRFHEFSNGEELEVVIFMLITRTGKGFGFELKYETRIAQTVY